MANDSLKERLKQKIDNKKQILNYKEMYIYGMGNTSKLLKEGLDRIRDRFVVKGYTCSNPMSEVFNGELVLAKEKISKIENVCMLICSATKKSIREIIQEIESLDMEWYMVDQVIFQLFKNEIIEVYDSLCDDHSKEIFCEVVCSRIDGSYVNPKYVSENQYFDLPEFMYIDEDEVFVDCGAYTGDTIEKFIWNRSAIFKKIIAFEPDRGNYAAMLRRLKRLCMEWNISENSIKCYLAGVGEDFAQLPFNRRVQNNGHASSFVETGSDMAQVYSIDDMISEEYTLLKADIEGYEYKMLLGAQNTIKKWKPKLAICIYHNPVDLFSIPLLIKSLVPEYKLSIRHHSYRMDETVVYAYIDDSAD